MTHRSLALGSATVLAIAAIAAPALAGTDSDDEDGAPVTTPAPVPIVRSTPPVVPPARRGDLKG
jgi:hypothetical protein